MTTKYTNKEHLRDSSSRVVPAHTTECHKLSGLLGIFTVEKLADASQHQVVLVVD